MRPNMSVNTAINIGFLMACLLIALPVNAKDIQPVKNTVAAKHPGQALFQTNCAYCHDTGMVKAPNTNNLRLMTAQAIYRIQIEGAMKPRAAHLKDSEKQLIAEYLSGKRLNDAPDIIPALQCAKKDGGWFNSREVSAGMGWGIDAENSRFIPDDIANLPLKDVKSLRLEWAYSYSNALRARSQPAIAGGGLFVGSHSGEVYALDAKSGCQHWTFQASGEVRTAIVVSPGEGIKPSQADGVPLLYFGDYFGNVYALDAGTGALIWKVKVDDDPTATITGSPVLYKGQLFVTLSAIGNFDDSCCTNRGAIIALDARTGIKRWKTYTIPSPAIERYRNADGIPQYGPSGASVMNSPTIDKKRGLLYFGTGQNHSSPSDGNSDAIFALAIDDGHVVWKTQVTAGDIWPVSSSHPKNENEVHVDNDFSASPILIHGENQKDILVAGQKLGEVFGLNPDDGSILWRNQVGRGAPMGGVHFGMAAQGQTVFVPIHDNDTWLETLQPMPVGPARPGLYALDAFTGKMLWSAPLSKYCPKNSNCLGFSAAITAIPGVVFAARRDGVFHAFNSTNGKMIWAFDTAREFTALNGQQANGGSIAGPGPLIVNGMVYINSGYGIYGSSPGNVLLAFSVKK